MHNHLIGVVFSNGEIFSNLRFTQGMYDVLRAGGHTDDLLERGAAQAAALETYQTLIQQESVLHDMAFIGPEADALRAEVTALYSDRQRSGDLLRTLDTATRVYARSFGPK
jgi:CRISPR-associated protein Csc2